MPDSPCNTLQDFFARHARVTVLTGAGCSTASGIPDYRDDAGEWKHARPVQFAEFTGSEPIRRRYWARSFSGWQRISAAKPNATHLALAALERGGRVAGLITQNVDNLHRSAGSERVIDLHGVLHRTCCLGCGAKGSRAAFQESLAAANPHWAAATGDVRPDGDFELIDAATESFQVPECPECGGIIKPDVVFFGETVPAQRVADARTMIDDADALLIVGSSLMVFSGFRFARHAHAAGKPLAILNRGRTRADEIAALRVHADCGDTLLETAAALPPATAAGLAL